jgi:hypothetical protein
MGAGRVRARRGSGSIRVRNGRVLAQVSLGTDAHGRRIRRSRTFDSRTQAETWIATQQLEHRQLTNPVTDDHLEDYLRWWLAIEAPKGKPGRQPLARTTLAHYRVVIEHHLIPELGHRKVGQLAIHELDVASRKLAVGYAPATVNRMRETLRSALSTAVRQDRLIRNVARYGGGVAAARPPVDRFTDHELALLLKAARDEHFFPILLLLARTGLRIGEACGLRWRDLDLTSMPPRLTVVWQLDRWGDLVPPKTATPDARSRCGPRSPPNSRRGVSVSGSGRPTAPATSTALSSPPAPDVRSISATSVAPSTGHAPRPAWTTAASRPSAPRSRTSSPKPACTRARPRPSSATPT